MEAAAIQAKNVDGVEVMLLPDVINLMGIGWDVFHKDHVTFPDCLTMFREVQEMPDSASYHDIRRFSLKLDANWFSGTEEDPEMVFMASYFKDEEGQWVFRLDSYEDWYKDTPAERWIDW